MNKQRRRLLLRLAAGLAGFTSLILLLQSPGVSQQPSLTVADATELLRQIRGGLVAHNLAQMLSAFDLTNMKDGRLFQQHTRSFFAQTGTIRVHFNMLRASMDGEKGIVDANFEMEAAMADDRLPPLYKQAQLRLVCNKTSAGWRIVELTPSDFFTTQQ